MSENIGEATADLLKGMVEEIRTLRKRVEQLESDNNVLVKAVDNPETMMKKAGWLKAVTPMAEEVFDPLQRGQGDTFTSAFNSEAIVKSQSDELREWEEMEANMPSTTSPSSIKYR